MVRWVVEMYIEVASYYEFMGRGSGNREEGVKFIETVPEWWAGNGK